MEAYFTEYQRLFYHSRYYHNRPLELGWDFPWYDPKLIFFFLYFPIFSLITETLSLFAVTDLCSLVVAQLTIT